MELLRIRKLSDGFRNAGSYFLFDVKFIHVLWDSICCILIKIKAAIKRQAYFLQREWKTANLLMHVNSHVKYKPCILYMHLQKEKYCYRNSFFILIKINDASI